MELSERPYSKAVASGDVIPAAHPPSFEGAKAGDIAILKENGLDLEVLIIAVPDATKSFYEGKILSCPPMSTFKCNQTIQFEENKIWRYDKR